MPKKFLPTLPFPSETLVPAIFSPVATICSILCLFFWLGLGREVPHHFALPPSRLFSPSLGISLRDLGVWMPFVLQPIRNSEADHACFPRNLSSICLAKFFFPSPFRPARPRPTRPVRPPFSGKVQILLIPCLDTRPVRD